jgi:hypothetical protein
MSWFDVSQALADGEEGWRISAATTAAEQNIFTVKISMDL